MDHLCLISLCGDFLSRSFTARHVAGGKEKKKIRGGVSCSRIVVKRIIIISWQQASRQMVFEKKPTAGRERTVG